MDKVLLVLWPTGNCNLNCQYCYAKKGQQLGNMTFEIAKKTLDYFKDKSIKVQFAGGEPLLRFELIKQIYEYVQVKQYTVSFQIQTNGTLIDEEIAKTLKAMKFAVGVSLDGNVEINDRLRGKTTYVNRGIKYLAEEDIIINLNAVVSTANINEIHKLADIAMYFGNVQNIGLDLLRTAGNARISKSIQQVTAQQLKEGIIQLQNRCDALYKITGKKIGVRPVEEARIRLTYGAARCSKDYCYASSGRSYVVLPNGDVYPCGSLIEDESYKIGNILVDSEMKPRALKKKESIDCENCEYYKICSGACPARIITNHWQNQANTLDCIMKKIAFEIAAES